MTGWLKIIIFVVYHFVNIFLGWQNKQVVQKRLNHKDLRQIEHFAWGAMYGALCLPWYWIPGHGWGIWYVLALVPLHLSVFAPAYNDYRGLAPFNLSLTSKSIIDKTLVKMGFKTLEWPCLISEVLAAILLTISILKK